jgi:hypothetical protein
LGRGEEELISNNILLFLFSFLSPQPHPHPHHLSPGASELKSSSRYAVPVNDPKK